MAKNGRAVQTAEATEAWNYDFCAAYDIIPIDGEATSHSIVEMSVEVASANQPFINKLYNMKRNDYSNDVVFRSDGAQGNPVRELVRRIGTGTATDRQAAGSLIAHRMAAATPGQAPRGLLVLLAGTVGTRKRVAIWRFPNHDTMSVVKKDDRFFFAPTKAFVGEEAKEFKAASFEGTESQGSMWKGRVKDFQTANQAIDVAKYWMEFLECDRLLSPAYATQLACQALQKTAAKAETENEREEIDAAALVLKAQDGVAKTMNDVAATVPEPRRQDFIRALKLPDDQLDQAFTIKAAQVESSYRFRVLAFEHGVTIKARREAFEDDTITVERGIENGQDRVTIKGRIIKDKSQAG